MHFSKTFTCQQPKNAESAVITRSDCIPNGRFRSCTKVIVSMEILRSTKKYTKLSSIEWVIRACNPHFLHDLGLTYLRNSHSKHGRGFA